MNNPEFKKPVNAEEYSKLEKILDKLIDEVRDNEHHPLARVMQTIGEKLEEYDDEHNPPLDQKIK